MAMMQLAQNIQNHPLAQQARQQMSAGQQGRQVQQNLFNQASGNDPYMQLAGQQLQQGSQQPSLWGQAEGAIQQRLSPGYSAYSPQESDARFQSMQRRINEGYDQQGRALSESLNQRGLYRTGLYDQMQHQFVEDPRGKALNQAAIDVYLSGQDATRAEQQNALAMALGLGGQQAGMQQQHFHNLLAMSQIPFQQELALWNAIYGPEQQQRSQASQGFWGGLGQIAGSILPWIFGF